jgi:hypothetical protein
MITSLILIMILFLAVAILFDYLEAVNSEKINPISLGDYFGNSREKRDMKNKLNNKGEKNE